MRRALCAAVALTCILHASAAVQPVDACAASAGRSDGDNDLYCIELLPALDIDGATGIARLVPPSSPFGIAVTQSAARRSTTCSSRCGICRIRRRSASTPRIVAWATTPQLRPVVKLGEVRDGTQPPRSCDVRSLSAADYGRGVASVTEPRGRVVLRGTSASMRMQPHDLAFLLAGLIDSEGNRRRRSIHGTPVTTLMRAPRPVDGHRRRCIRKCRCRRRS